MGAIVTIHSYRGGTGKSNVTANLAATLAQAGRRVGIIDTDIQSPGIHVLFGLEAGGIKHTINDYLQARCPVESVAVDVGSKVQLPAGQVFLLPASLDYVEIAKVIKNGYDLDRMTDGFRQAVDRLKLDYLLVDTHPGLAQETMLFTVMSRLLLVLLRPDQQDYLGTAVVTEVARKLGVPLMGLVVNKLLPEFDANEVRARMTSTFKCPVMGLLPFDMGVLSNASQGLMVLKNPEHPWSRGVRGLCEQVLAQCPTTPSCPTKNG